MAHSHFAVMKGKAAVAYYESEKDARTAAPTYGADPDDVVAATPPKHAGSDDVTAVTEGGKKKAG